MGLFTDLNDKIKQTIKAIKMVDGERLHESVLNKHNETILILSSMANQPVIWEMCDFNIKMQEARFISYIENITNEPIFYLDKIDTFWNICTRFLVELHFFSHSKNVECLTPELDSIAKGLREQAFYHRNLSDMEIRYMFYEMPINIMNFYMRDEGFNIFRKFEDRKREIITVLKDSEGKLESNLDKVSELDKTLKKQKTAFNFVGLSQGFEKILAKKKTAKWLTFIVLLVMLLATLTPLGFSFEKFIKGEELSWQKMLPVIGLEFVLIYFFRVVLAHYNSIQTQIMQLELRQSLCQFIQNYAEYAKEMKSNDGVSLEKFENLIFSSILSNPDKVPGTFDGVEGLTALVKELRGGK